MTNSRRTIDRKLPPRRLLAAFAMPPSGWIRTIREALGMTTAQLARRLSVAQPVVVRMEQSEAQGRIQLDTLRRAAEALNCDVVYALVPREPLETFVAKRRAEKAAQEVRNLEHTMAMELQHDEDRSERKRREREVRDSLRDRDLWDE